MNLICFDLEGPLSPQDNAYELMKLFPDGDKLFEVISRYDDLLTLEGRQNYEPGDTLALIAPFLSYHGLKEEQISTMGQRANLTQGALPLISRLKTQGWHVFVISTSYEQYALSITQRLSIPSEDVACTFFPLNQIHDLSREEDLMLLKKAEIAIKDFKPFTDDVRIKQTLDHLYWQQLPQTTSGMITSKIKPRGGIRKVEALDQFAARLGAPLSHCVSVGDSITDFKMLEAVNKAGGLAIAFNANEYALNYATMSLASTNLDDLWIILVAWEKGGRQATEMLVKQRQQMGGKGDRGHFHWLDENKDVTQVLKIHKRIRNLVRKEAAKLG
ncbi:MAG: HAD hydrolase family protein [Chloroflexota bacterium]|nr:HAD hydrolase family protein [Chloroflexota bacterium]